MFSRAGRVASVAVMQFCQAFALAKANGRFSSFIVFHVVISRGEHKPGAH
jgi:hypothetical protein